MAMHNTAYYIRPLYLPLIGIMNEAPRHQVLQCKTLYQKYLFFSFFSATTYLILSRNRVCESELQTIYWRIEKLHMTRAQRSLFVPGLPWCSARLSQEAAHQTIYRQIRGGDWAGGLFSTTGLGWASLQNKYQKLNRKKPWCLSQIKICYYIYQAQHCMTLLHYYLYHYLLLPKLSISTGHIYTTIARYCMDIMHAYIYHPENGTPCCHVFFLKRNRQEFCVLIEKSENKAKA